MAKILPGPLASKISGTIGGTTYSNYRGMIIARKKPTPTQTLSPRRTFIQSLMSLLSRAWRDELNAGLRTAWNQRAKNYPWVDVFGNERKMTGENLYIKQNIALLDHSLTRQDTPAPDVVPPELIDLVATVTAGGQLRVDVPGLDAGIITEQAPFLDIWVAGGFLSFDQAPTQVEVFSHLLPAGRKAQKSDFRHVVYADDIPATLPEDKIEITVEPDQPSGTTNNAVFILRRYNKYGNFSAPRMFDGIVNP